MLLESLHNGGHPDPILNNLVQAVKEQLPATMTIIKADGTLFIGERGRNRNLEVRRNNDVVSVRSPVVGAHIYAGPDPYQALGAIVSYFSNA